MNEYLFSCTSVVHMQQPIGSLNIVGSANAHQLISLSTDGRLCSWTLDMLAKPYEAIDLMVRAQTSNSYIVTVLDVRVRY